MEFELGIHVRVNNSLIAVLMTLSFICAMLLFTDENRLQRPAMVINQSQLDPNAGFVIYRVSYEAQFRSYDWWQM